VYYTLKLSFYFLTDNQKYAWLLEQNLNTVVN